MRCIEFNDFSSIKNHNSIVIHHCVNSMSHGENCTIIEFISNGGLYKFISSKRNEKKNVYLSVFE